MILPQFFDSFTRSQLKGTAAYGTFNYAVDRFEEQEVTPRPVIILANSVTFLLAGTTLALRVGY